MGGRQWGLYQQGGHKKKKTTIDGSRSLEEEEKKGLAVTVTMCSLGVSRREKWSQTIDKELLYYED